jgi:proteic killer suppression protein
VACPSADRRSEGTWSLTVSRNWRITFDVTREGKIENLDFENYH